MKRTELEFWRARDVARLLALVEGERRYYQEILAALPAGVAVLDARLGFLMANRCFRTIFGLTPEGLARARLEDFFPGEEMRRSAREALEKGTARVNVRIDCPAGDRPRPLLVSLLPFHSPAEDAEPELLLAVLDLEARPETEAAAAGVAVHPLLRDMDAVVWEKSPETFGFTQLVGSAEGVLGFPAEAWLASPSFFTERIHPADREWVAGFYRASLGVPDRRSCEYRLLGPGGQTLWVRDVFRAVRDEAGKPLKLSGITTSLTGRKLLEEELVRNERLQAMGRLAARVSHECNNLLMIAGGYSEDLLANLPPESPLRENVEQIVAATDRLSRLTGQLLRLARKPELTAESFLVNDFLARLEEPIRRQLGDDIELELRLAPAAGRVKADPGALSDAVLAFAARAREAMPGGGRWLVETRQVEIADACPPAAGMLKPGLYAGIVLTDTGPAPDDEARRTIFDPGLVEERPGPDLAGACRTVKELGGGIHVDAAPGGGARFTILLPAEEPAPETGARPAETAAEAPAPPPRTVLVAEDEEGIRKLVARVLRKQGFAVIEAPSGEEALRLADSHEGAIDLLIADVQLGGIRGDELARRLQDRRPGMKVLLVSGYTGEELGPGAAPPEGAAFLEKPFSLTKLLGQVRSLLGSG